MMNILKNKKLLSALILVGISVAMFLVVIFITSDKSSIPKQAQGEAREAYVFAMERGDILEQLPCYCGCHKVGHKNNWQCFYDDSGKPDNHGSYCGVCIDIALTAKKMIQDGFSIEEIHEHLEKKYQGMTAT